jgi:Smg protein
MKNNVIEIISMIIKRMLKEEVLDQEKVISELLNLGYNIEDIDQAFEIILSESDYYGEDENNKVLRVDNAKYNRVFTIAEKLYLPLKLQGLIYRLIVLNVLSPKKSEKLIYKTTQKVYKGSANTADLWDVLNEVVDDDSKLEIISEKIPEFNDYLQKEFKHIN